MTAVPLRIGMVGGGPGAFIGAVHRIALAMDGEFRLVAGAFSSDPERSRLCGEGLGLDPTRVYGSWAEMAASEAALPAGIRIDAVAVVTPNHLHHAPILAFLRHGIHVLCDKPLTVSSELAAELRTAVSESGCVFVLSHPYSAYPMVLEARRLVRDGVLGDLRKVHVEYLQDWLSDPVERQGQKQAEWRTDPERSGPGGALGDIGTHAFQLLEEVCGRRVLRLLGVRRSCVVGRRVDDDAELLLELEGGVTGTLICSQVCVGCENDLRLRVFGSAASLEWWSQSPAELRVARKGRPLEIRRAAHPYLGESAAAASRVPPGHPEGFLEGFANLYRSFARAIRGTPGPGDEALPGVVEGERGVRFVEAAVASSASGNWVEIARCRG